MTHELVKKNGVAEMAYTGQACWHGLGTKLQQGASIDQWREAAGMNWTICRSKVRYVTDLHGTTITMPKQHVLFRSDSSEALGVVSSKFQVVQPREVLEFFRDLVEESGFKLETAGTLFGGRKFWALASTGEGQEVLDGDIVKPFLLVSTGADGKTKTRVKPVCERVVCHNTLQIALGEISREVKLSHHSKFNHVEVKRALGLMAGGFDSFMDKCRKLAQQPISDVLAGKFIGELLVENKAITIEDYQESKAWKEIMRLFNGAAVGAQFNEGSKWQLVNSVTEYCDHLQKASTESHRLDNAWFGKGDFIKSAAFQKALAA